MDLAGRVCIIPGGTSGIGATTPLAFAAKGASITLASRSGAISQEPTVKLMDSGTGFESMRVDVAEAQDCLRCVEETVVAKVLRKPQGIEVPDRIAEYFG